MSAFDENPFAVSFIINSNEYYCQFMMTYIFIFCVLRIPLFSKPQPQVDNQQDWTTMTLSTNKTPRPQLQEQGGNQQLCLQPRRLLLLPCPHLHTLNLHNKQLQLQIFRWLINTNYASFECHLCNICFIFNTCRSYRYDWKTNA